MCLLAALLTAWPALGQPGLPGSALEALERARPGASSELDDITRAILSRVTPDQLDAIRAGTPFEEIRLADGRTLAEFLDATFGTGPFALPWSTIDGGGGSSSGGSFSLAGTIGQPDAGNLLGGPFTLLGGYWDFRRTGPLFADGFETGDLSEWSMSQGGLP
jgi:hypothetical protein